MFKFLPVIVITLGSFHALAQSKIDSLEKVLTIITNDSLKVYTYLHLRAAYHRIDQQKALEYTLKAEALAKEAGLTSSLGEAKYRKGTVLLTMSVYDQAEIEFQEALKIFKSLGSKKGIVSVKIDLARLQQIQSKTEEAISLFFEAIPLTQQIDDRNAEARIYNYLGESFKIQRQYDKAIMHYELALELVKELDFEPGISACLANLGAVYTEIGDYDKAIAYHEEALQLKRGSGDKLGASRVLTNLGEAFLLKGQFDLSESYFNDAYDLAKEVNNISHQAIVEYGLARMYLQRGDATRSIEVAKEIVTTLRILKDLDLAVKTHGLLFQAYMKAGRTEEALANAMLHSQLSDSLYNEKILSVTNELEVKYQNEQKLKEIALLESRNNFQTLQIQKGENERNYLIALTIVILLLLALGYNQYRIKQKANVRLEELDKLKSDFFANISHEFRTPLSLIMAPLKEMMDKTSDNHNRHGYQLMYRNADRLLKLIDQLLDLSKLEHKSFVLKKSNVEIGHLLKIIVASFSSLAEYKKIQFNSSLPVGKNFVVVDQDIIQKICYNLLSNAFKFTSEEGEVSFDATISQSRLKILVSDSGSGVPLKDQEKIFDRFFQSSAGNHLGTGIGLALTKELVEFHGGKINLERSSVEGSVFAVVIPVQRAKEADDNDSNDVGSVLTIDYGGKQMTQPELVGKDGPVVLVIEDNPDLASYLNEILSKDYVVHHSSNGSLGIMKAKEVVPDLIISDVMMPVKDGIQVCEELKQATETDHIPIILLTARADQESKISGLTTGADDYLLKPFDPDELKARVSNLLAQRTKLREKYSKQLLLESAEMKISGSQEVFLKSIKKIVSQHLDNSEFTAEDFSKEMGMSRMQLHRKLTALTGQSATSFVREQRLVKASQLLRSGEPVSQVAYAVGFSSLSYFTKNFKQAYGVAPSEYKMKSM